MDQKILLIIFRYLIDICFVLFTVDEGIQNAKEIGMMGRICHVKTVPQRDGPEHVPLTKTLRNRF